MYKANIIAMGNSAFATWPQIDALFDRWAKAYFGEHVRGSGERDETDCYISLTGLLDSDKDKFDQLFSAYDKDRGYDPAEEFCTGEQSALLPDYITRGVLSESVNDFNMATVGNIIAISDGVFLMENELNYQELLHGRANDARQEEKSLIISDMQKEIPVYASFQNKLDGTMLVRDEFLSYVLEEAERQFNDCHDDEKWTDLSHDEKVLIFKDQFDHQLNDRDWLKTGLSFENLPSEMTLKNYNEAVAHLCYILNKREDELDLDDNFTPRKLGEFVPMFESTNYFGIYTYSDGNEYYLVNRNDGTFQMVLGDSFEFIGTNYLECLKDEQILDIASTEFLRYLVDYSTDNAKGVIPPQNLEGISVLSAALGSAPAQQDMSQKPEPPIYQYGDFPTLEEIRSDYARLMKLIKGVKTIEQAKKLDGPGRLTVEINGMSIDEFENGLKTINGRSSFRGTDQDIEWIRYEFYGCLSYIYDRFDGSPMFDVWCNAGDEHFITDVRISDLTEENYARWVKNETERLQAARTPSIDQIIQSAAARVPTSHSDNNAPAKPLRPDR